MGKWTLRVAVVQALALAATLTLALDMYAHKRVEDLDGVNFWGYRGPVAAQRRPNEIRVVVVGGTRAFGWGHSSPILASQLRRLILLTTDRPGSALRPVTVINLGRLGALPDSYAGTLDHFSYLQPDYICIYDDLGMRGTGPNESASAVFALTGYAPVLPRVLREKGMAWLGAGLGAADRVAARPLARRDDRPAPYGDAMIAAIEAAHRYAHGVVVAVSPADTAAQAGNLRVLTARLRGNAGSAPWLRFVDLGAEARLRGDALRRDGWNYDGVGTTVVAEQITPALLSLIDQP